MKVSFDFIETTIVEQNLPYWEVYAYKESKHPVFVNATESNLSESVSMLKTKVKQITEGRQVYVHISDKPLGKRSVKTGGAKPIIYEHTLDLSPFTTGGAAPITGHHTPSSGAVSIDQYIAKVQEVEQLKSDIARMQLQQQIDELRQAPQQSKTDQFLEVLLMQFANRGQLSTTVPATQGIASPGDTPQDRVKNSLSRIGSVLGGRMPEVLEDLAAFVEKSNASGNLETMLNLLKSQT